MAVASPIQPTPFDEGYLAAAAFSHAPERVRRVEPNPYALSSAAGEAWLYGWNEWQMDVKAGMTPPLSRL